MSKDKNGSCYRARTIVTLCLLVLYPAAVSCAPVLHTFEGRRDQHGRYGHGGSKIHAWTSPRSLLGEKSERKSEDGQTGSAGADEDVKEAPSDTDAGARAEEKAPIENDNSPSGVGSSDITAPPFDSESITHAEEPKLFSNGGESDGSADRSGTSGIPSKELRAAVREDSSSAEEPESKWTAFLSWLGFNSDAKDNEVMRESNSRNAHRLSNRDQVTTSRDGRKRGGIRDKIDSYRDEGDATMRDMAAYLSENERRRSKVERTQDFEDAPDEIPYSGGQERTYPDVPDKKRRGTEHGISSTNPKSSIRDSSSSEKRVGDWMLDHGGLSDVDVLETVRSFARLFAAIDKRLNGHSDEDIHDTHSQSVRKLYTPERATAWNSPGRSHNAWSKSHFRKRGAL